MATGGVRGKVGQLWKANIRATHRRRQLNGRLPFQDLNWEPEHINASSRLSTCQKEVCSNRQHDTIMKKPEFLKAVDTLKLYRRAELIDEIGHELISDLYVDPLPDNHILSTVLKPNTTFLIGRKGTGKSTIFQRAQDSLNQDKTATWAYIDIKTLYESSTAEIIGGIPSAYEAAL